MSRHSHIAPRPRPRYLSSVDHKSAGVEERARAAVHEQLTIGVVVIRVEAHAARARSKEQPDHARPYKSVSMSSRAAAEEIFRAVVLIAFARASVVVDVHVI